MTYYPRFSISADPMPSARPEWIGLQLTTGLWVSATFSCSGMGQGFCYGHPGGIRLIAILAQRETAELVSQGHLRWPPSVGQDWGAIRKCWQRLPLPDSYLAGLSSPLAFVGNWPYWQTDRPGWLLLTRPPRVCNH